MKKTLIALLALAPVAFATTGEEFNQMIADSLSGYTGVNFRYAAKLNNIGNTNQGFITLTTLPGEGETAQTFYIVNQSHSYWGLANVSSNNFTQNSAYTLATDTVEGVTTYTYTSTENVLPFTWTRNADNTSSETRTVGAWIGVDISTDGTDSAITLSYAGTTNKIDTFILKGTVLDAHGVTFANNIGGVSDITIVPEPATATLSLLALAGLAARRRRK